MVFIERIVFIKKFYRIERYRSKIKREMKELLFMPIIATVDDVDKFEKKRN